MNKLSVMTLGFLNETFYPFKADKDVEALRNRYVALFEDIKSAGFSAIDIASFEVMYLGEDFVLGILKKFEFSVASYIHIGNFADPDILPQQNLANAKNAIDFAKKTQTKNFMIVPSPHSGITEMRAEDIVATIAENVKAIAGYAISKGLTVIIEDYPDPSLHLSSAKDVECLLNAVDGLKLVYDSANMLIVDEDPVEYAKHFKGRIAHVHIKDLEILDTKKESGERTIDGRAVKTAVIGEGCVDIPAVIKTLVNDEYSGYFALEFGDLQGMKRLQILEKAKKTVEDALL